MLKRISGKKKDSENQIIDYHAILPARKKVKKSLSLSLKESVCIVVNDAKTLATAVMPKNIFLVRFIKFSLLLLLFCLPLAAVINVSSNGTPKQDPKNSGKAVPQPNPQPQSHDQAFYITFSTSFQSAPEPVVISYPVTVGDGRGGSAFTTKTTNISGPSYIYIALNAPPRITFTIATGKTNQYVFQLLGSNIIQQEHTAGQQFNGFLIFYDPSAVVKPDYNNNNNKDVYSLYTSTPMNSMYERQQVFQRPDPYTNLPPRLEILFSIPANGGDFPHETDFNFKYVHADDNDLTPDSVVAYEGENQKNLWLSTETKKLPEAGYSTNNTYYIDDDFVNEGTAEYTVGMKDQSAPANDWYNFGFTMRYVSDDSPEIYFDLNLHYMTGYVYNFALRKINSEQDKKGNVFFGATFSLYKSKIKAIWI